MRVSWRRKQLSGSKAVEPLGEGPRAAGIDPAKWPARDARTAVMRHTFGAGVFEALGEGPRAEGVDPPRKAARDAMIVALRRTIRAGGLWSQTS